VLANQPQRVTLEGVGDLPQPSDGSGREADSWFGCDHLVRIQLPSTAPPIAVTLWTDDA
jgi:hypothetical protein